MYMFTCLTIKKQVKNKHITTLSKERNINSTQFLFTKI